MHYTSNLVICSDIGIEDINENDVTKEEINDAIFYHHYKEMKEEMKVKDKLNDVKNDDFTNIQNYMKDKTIEGARVMFSLRSRMFSCRGNQHGSFGTNNRGCPACVSARAKGDTMDPTMVAVAVEEETQGHLAECPQYQHLRQGLDLYTQGDMVKYYMAVTREREKFRDKK